MTPSTRHCMLVQWWAWLSGLTVVVVVAGFPIWASALFVADKNGSLGDIRIMVGVVVALWLAFAGVLLIGFMWMAKSEPTTFNEPDYTDRRLRRRVVARRTFLMWLCMQTMLLAFHMMTPDDVPDIVLVLLIVLSLGAVFPALHLARRSLKWTIRRQAERVGSHLPCLHCSYDLRGLSSDRCPECGASRILNPEPA